jgi:hypothetical protein
MVKTTALKDIYRRRLGASSYVSVRAMRVSALLNRVVIWQALTQTRVEEMVKAIVQELRKEVCVLLF